VAIPYSEAGFSALLVFIFFVWIKRVLWMIRFRKNHPPLTPARFKETSAPLVSMIIPARNEEKNIANCLEHLLNQTYPNCEVIVVDDRSSDRTPQILEDFKKNSRLVFKMIRIDKLPSGWTGKNYAVFTGSRAANGEWFLFTDADTTHKPESLETAMALCAERKIDFLTLAPEVESKSFWEDTVQPLAVGSLALWFDPDKINDPKNPIVLANGQYLLIRREAYEKVGGNESVKDRVVEDVELAKKMRAAGYLVQFLDGTRLYSTRMYSSLREIKTGWIRILTYLFNKNIPAILHKIFLFIIFSILPFLILSLQFFLKFQNPDRFSPLIFSLALSVSAWIVLVRFIGNKAVRANPWYAFLHPLGSLVMIWILLACVGRIIFKQKSVWRGEYYK
jgi:glycosyltransferase involved in cell wall biosynthesis